MSIAVLAKNPLPCVYRMQRCEASRSHEQAQLPGQVGLKGTSSPLAGESHQSGKRWEQSAATPAAQHGRNDAGLHALFVAAKAIGEGVAACNALSCRDDSVNSEAAGISSALRRRTRTATSASPADNDQSADSSCHYLSAPPICASTCSE